MPFTFQNQTFRSVRAMTAELEARKRRLHNKFGGARCDPETDADAAWLWQLIGMHCRGSEKITPRVKGFAVDEVAGLRRGTLHILLLDDSGARMLNDAKGGRPTMVGKDGIIAHHFCNTGANERLEAMDAFRSLVRDQTHKVLTEARAAGQVTDGRHVGHGFDGTDPFGALVVRYLASRGMPGLSAVALRRLSPESGQFELCDAELAQGFRAYHAQHANMRMQDAKENAAGAHADKMRMRSAEAEAAALTGEQRDRIEHDGLAALAKREAAQKRARHK